jgi:hypothetical protein
MSTNTAQQITGIVELETKTEELSNFPFTFHFT